MMSTWNLTCLWNTAGPALPLLYSTRKLMGEVTLWLSSATCKHHETVTIKKSNIMELIEIPTLSYVVSGTGRGTKHLDTIHNNTTILKKIMLRMVSTALERQTIEKQMTSIMRWMQMEGHQQKSPNRQRDKPINFKNSYYGGGANEKQLHPE